METVRVAAVQAAPVFLDREATIDKVVTLFDKAASEGAGLVVFPETFIPTYPDWVWRTKPWDHDASALFAVLLDQSVVVPGPATEVLAEAARRNKAWLSIGVNERDEPGSTLYNTQLYFRPDGSLAARHRKLMPTGGERLVWGMGDGSTLLVLDTPFGRLGGLTCWENYMPLARFFLYSEGVDIWIAPTLAAGEFWIATLRHIAREGGCYVVGINPCVHADQIPNDFPNRESLLAATEEDDDKWLEPGNTVIIAPNSKILAGPVQHEETILYAEVDLAQVHAARRMFDPVGHYHRPDVFRLAVDTRPRAAVIGFESASEDEDGRIPA